MTGLKLKIKFTEGFVASAGIPENREVTYTDLTQKGLTLRVLASGHRTYYARLWNTRTKRMRKIKIGDASLLSVLHARRAVRKLQRKWSRVGTISRTDATI